MDTTANSRGPPIPLVSVQHQGTGAKAWKLRRTLVGFEQDPRHSTTNQGFWRLVLLSRIKVRHGCSRGACCWAAIGTVFSELYGGVQKLSKSNKPILDDLQTTLESLKPIVDEMRDCNDELDPSCKEIAAFHSKIEEGVKLVCKLSIVDKWYKNRTCIKQLVELNGFSQNTYKGTDRAAARNGKKTRVLAKKIEKKLNLVVDVVRNQVDNKAWCATLLTVGSDVKSMLVYPKLHSEAVCTSIDLTSKPTRDLEIIEEGLIAFPERRIDNEVQARELTLRKFNAWLDDPSAGLHNLEIYEASKEWFIDLMTAGMWLSVSHVDVFLHFARKNSHLQSQHLSPSCAIMDTLFWSCMNGRWNAFQHNPDSYNWDSDMLDYPVGKSPKHSRPWSEVESLYLPVNIRNRHWIAVCVDLMRRKLTIYDSTRSQSAPEDEFSFDILKPMATMLPSLLVQSGFYAQRPELNPLSTPFKVVHPEGDIPRQSASGDCGVFMLKFLEY